jgi:hypothetical protein
MEKEEIEKTVDPLTGDSPFGDAKTSHQIGWRCLAPAGKNPKECQDPLIALHNQEAVASLAALTFAHLALAAAAILALDAALIFLRLFRGAASCLVLGSAIVLAFAHLAFWAATFFARPAALNLYFFRVFIGACPVRVAVSSAVASPFPARIVAS